MGIRASQIPGRCVSAEFILAGALALFFCAGCAVEFVADFACGDARAFGYSENTIWPCHLEWRVFGAPCSSTREPGQLIGNVAPIISKVRRHSPKKLTAVNSGYVRALVSAPFPSERLYPPPLPKTVSSFSSNIMLL